MNTALKLTEKGQLTLKKEYLQHLGVLRGGYVDILKLPDGTLQIKPGQQGGKLSDVFGILAGKSSVTLTIDEMNDAIAAAHAEAGMKWLEE